MYNSDTLDSVIRRINSSAVTNYTQLDAAFEEIYQAVGKSQGAFALFKQFFPDLQTFGDDAHKELAYFAAVCVHLGTLLEKARV